MPKRRNHDAGFKARVALEAVKGERTASELAAEYGVHPTMIDQWKRALLEGAAEIFERCDQQAGERAQDLSLPTGWAAGRSAQSGLVRRHHLPADAAWVPLPSRHHGMVHP